MIDQKQGDLFSDNMLIDSLSPEFIREHKFLETGLTFKRSTANSQFYITAKTAWNEFGSTLWDVNNDNGTWFNILPTVFYEKRIRAGRRIKMRYGTSVNIPSAGLLLPVINITNPLLLVEGNVDLKPEYRHNVYTELSILRIIPLILGLIVSILILKIA